MERIDCDVNCGLGRLAECFCGDAELAKYWFEKYGADSGGDKQEN